MFAKPQALHGIERANTPSAGRYLLLGLVVGMPVTVGALIMATVVLGASAQAGPPAVGIPGKALPAAAPALWGAQAPAPAAPVAPSVVCTTFGFGAPASFAVGTGPGGGGGGRLQPRRQPRPGRGELSAPTTCRCCWATARAASARPPTSPWAAGPDGGGGGRLQPRRQPRPGRGELRLQQRVGAAGQRHRAASARHATSPWAPAPRRWRWATSTATATSTWPRRTPAPATCRCCWATAAGGFGAATNFAVGSQPARGGGGRLQPRRQPRPGRRRTQSAPTPYRCCWATAAAASARPPPSPWAPAPYAVAVGDFNRDGNPDLVTANAAPTTCRCCWATAAGGFGAATNFAVGSHPVRRGGGRLQPRRQPRPGRGELRLQQRVGAAGQRQRAASARPPTSPWARTPRVGGGGRTSTATATPTWLTANLGTDNVSVLLGNGTGGFGTRASNRSPCGTGPHAVAVGDFNRDGNPDLAVANYGSNNVSVLLGNGSGRLRRGHQLRRGHRPLRAWRWATSTATAAPTW